MQLIEPLLLPLSCILLGAALGYSIDWLEVKYEERRRRHKYDSGKDKNK